MKLHIHALALALVAGGAIAQSNNFCSVDRDNSPWLVVSNSKHTGTGKNYNWPPVNPAAYSSTNSMAGVPAGTQTVRWIPREVNLVRENQKVVGVKLGMRPSAATTQFPMTGYFPRTRFYQPKHQAGPVGKGWLEGEKLVLDSSKQTLIDVPQTSQTFASFGNFLITRNFSQPFTINQTDILIGWTWKGGEHMNKPGSQSIFGHFSDGIHSPRTVDFVDPKGAITTISTDFSVTWGTYNRQGPDLRQASDWGYRRDQRLLPQVTGRSIGTAQSDLSTSNGQLWWEVCGGATRQGQTVVMLFNAGPVFPAPFKILGVTLELNIADPNLAALEGYGGTIGTNGVFKGSQLPIPALGPSAKGFVTGAEAVLIDQRAGSLSSTGSAWTKVMR